jgi:hypothetical protein
VAGGFGTRADPFGLVWIGMALQPGKSRLRIRHDHDIRGTVHMKIRTPVLLIALCAAFGIVGQGCAAAQAAGQPWLSAASALARLRAHAAAGTHSPSSGRFRKVRGR